MVVSTTNPCQLAKSSQLIHKKKPGAKLRAFILEVEISGELARDYQEPEIIKRQRQSRFRSQVAWATQYIGGHACKHNNQCDYDGNSSGVISAHGYQPRPS